MQVTTELRAGSTALPDAGEKERLRGLFAELGEGRAAALGPLYDACADDLYGLALWRSGSEADAADVVQEVFVRLASLGPRLNSIEDPRAYLLRMTHRAAVDVHRKRTRRREDDLDTCVLLASDRSPELDVDAAGLSRRLAELPPKQREAIYLRHFAGCSFAEIGRATGAPTFTAASRYRSGMRRLRRAMGAAE